MTEVASQKLTPVERAIRRELSKLRIKEDKLRAQLNANLDEQARLTTAYSALGEDE